MSLESETFYIPPQVVGEVSSKVAAYTDPEQYYRPIFSEIEKSNKSLLNAINARVKDATDQRAYSLGLVIGFEATTQAIKFFGRRVQITDNDVNIWEQSILDYTGSKESDTLWPEEQFQLRLTTSKEFLSFIEWKANTFPREDSRRSFKRGVYGGSMPYFNKIDAEILWLSLWGQATPYQISLDTT